MKTYNDIYLETRNALRASGIEGYTLEARLLVATAAGKSVAELLRDINLYTTAAIDAEVQELTRRRLAGEPVAYITGAWEFYGLPMKVTPDVLIPRMDTELLVTTAKELLLGRKMDARILDLCCGSGCIACALGHELPATKLVAVDISANALEIARENFASNRLGSSLPSRQEFLSCSMAQTIRNGSLRAPSRLYHLATWMPICEKSSCTSKTSRERSPRSLR